MALVTADQIIQRFRSDVADALEGPETAPDANSLWKNDDVYNYLNAALEEWATRTRALFGRKAVTVVANDPIVRLPQSMRVYDIRRAVLRSAQRELTEYNIDDYALTLYDDYGLQISDVSSYEQGSGVPRYFTMNSVRDKMRLAPIPVASDTLDIDATFLPYVIYPNMPLPLSEYKDQHLVLLWMKKLAYEKHDADTLDLDRAGKFENEFEIRVADRETEHRRRTRRPQSIKANW